MSRGKKAKRKIGGRRKAEAAMVAATIRLADAEENSTKSLSCSTGGSPKMMVIQKVDDKREFYRSMGSADGKIKTTSLTILFKSDELQTLRNVLQKTDLSRMPLLLGAIILGKIEVVKRLLRDGYPINSRSEEDKTTALMWAVRNKDLEMINLLVRHGADLTLLDENEDNVALIAVQSSSWEQNDFLDFWNSIDGKINLKHTNTSGYTILHYAKQRQWKALTDLIDDKEPNYLAGKTTVITNNSSCFCCYCSTSSSSMRYKVKEKVLVREDVESTFTHLTVIFEEIMNRYREIWARDRELGYPGFRGGHGDASATLEDLMSLRHEEIARLNTILPKLEESYLQKLCNCWSSLMMKMRETSVNNWSKFEEYVTSIQIQLLTHEVCPPSIENLDFYSNNDRTFDSLITNDEISHTDSQTQFNDETSHGIIDISTNIASNYR